MNRYKVRAHANLRHYLPGAKEESLVESERPLSVRALLERLGIPESEVMTVSVGGEALQPERLIAQDCEVELFPVISGG